MHQWGEMYHYVDHGEERRDKLAREASESTTWYAI